MKRPELWSFDSNSSNTIVWHVLSTDLWCCKADTKRLLILKTYIQKTCQSRKEKAEQQQQQQQKCSFQQIFQNKRHPKKTKNTFLIPFEKTKTVLTFSPYAHGQNRSQPRRICSTRPRRRWAVPLWTPTTSLGPLALWERIWNGEVFLALGFIGVFKTCFKQICMGGLLFYLIFPNVLELFVVRACVWKCGSAFWWHIVRRYRIASDGLFWASLRNGDSVCFIQDVVVAIVRRPLSYETRRRKAWAVSEAGNLALECFADVRSLRCCFQLPATPFPGFALSIWSDCFVCISKWPCVFLCSIL